MDKMFEIEEFIYLFIIDREVMFVVGELKFKVYK